MRRAVVLTTAVVALPGAAWAQPRHHHHAHPARHHRVHREWAATREQALAIAEQKAHELWGATPCGGSYVVHIVTQAELASLIPGADPSAASSWESPTGPNSYKSLPSTWTDCQMWLDAFDWTPHQLAVDWAESCSIVLHEWGHLTGHPHSLGDWGEPVPPTEPPEPPGMTREQLEVMHAEGLDDVSRCGLEP